MTTPAPSDSRPDQIPVVPTTPLPAAIAAGDPAAQLLYALIAAQPFFKGLSPHRISEVAFAVGFQSISNFNRMFKRIVGRSPTCDRSRLPAPA